MNCTFPPCGKPSVKGGLCHSHHIEAKEAEWLDNSDINNLGIIRWAKELIPEYVPQLTPEFHKELFYDLLSLYNPKLKNKYERLYGLISFRGSAKSTAANTIFVAYVLAHNNRPFKIKVKKEIRTYTIMERAIVIISETGTAAEDFTIRIRDLFTESDRLKYYYKVKIQEARDSETGEWTKTSFKLNDSFVIARGSGMQIRGKIKGYSRPTMVIGDDLYSETNIKTETSRSSLRRWWNATVLNSVDDLNGKIILLGTILHEDTVLVDIESNPRWSVKKVPVMGTLFRDRVTGILRSDLTEFRKLIDEHLKVNMGLRTCYLPFDHIADKEKRFLKQQEYFGKVQSEYDWKLAWPERVNLYLLASKYQEAIYNNTLGEYYQEYFHEVVPSEERRFRSEYFRHIDSFEYKYEMGYNWLKLLNPITNVMEWEVSNIEMGVDLSAGRSGGDEGVITIIASTPTYQVYVLYQIAKQFSLRDSLLRGQQSYNPEDLRMKVLSFQESETLVDRVGIVDEVYRLARKFHPSSIKIGVAGEEITVVEEIHRIFQINGLYEIEILPRKQTRLEGNKYERIANTLLPYYETRSVYHVQGLEALEYQLKYLGGSKQDDRADSLECAFYSLEYPLSLNYENMEKRYKKLNDKSDSMQFLLKKIKKEYNLFNNFREYF